MTLHEASLRDVTFHKNGGSFSVVVDGDLITA